MIVGTENKFQLVLYLDDILAEQGSDLHFVKRSEPLIFYSHTISQKDFTMDSVKISSNILSQHQNPGRILNFFCSYCIVPYTRGRDRSRKI